MQRLVASLAAIILGFLAFAVELRADEAAEHWKRAKEWSEKREYDKAIAECDDALDIDPKLVGAYGTRASAHFAVHDYDNTMADCTWALAIDPNFVDAYVTRGEVFLERGETERAIVDWKQALTISPNDWHIFNDLGVGAWNQAGAQGQKADRAEAAGKSEVAESCRQRALALKEDAKAQWLHGIALSPAAVDCDTNLGYAYSEAHDYETAEHYLLEAVRIDPASARPHNNLGRVMLQLGHKRKEEACQVEANGDIVPADAAAPIRLRREAQEMIAGAVKQFEEAIRLDPSLMEARFNMAQVYLSSNRLKEAEAQYKEILNAHSESGKALATSAQLGYAWHGLAKVAIARHASDEAVKDLQKSLEFNPNFPPSLQLLARQRFERHEYREGEKCLRSLLESVPASQRSKLASQFEKPYRSDPDGNDR